MRTASEVCVSVPAGMAELDLSLSDALTEGAPPSGPDGPVQRDFVAQLEAEAFDDQVGEVVVKMDYIPLLDKDDAKAGASVVTDTHSSCRSEREPKEPRSDAEVHLRRRTHLDRSRFACLSVQTRTIRWRMGSRKVEACKSLVRVLAQTLAARYPESSLFGSVRVFTGTCPSEQLS